MAERATEATDVGSGLSLWRNAFTALDAVGLAERVRALGKPPDAGQRAGQRDRHGRWLAEIPHAATTELRIVHRADLHRVLAEALAPGTIRWGSPVDDTPEGYDLVVAADGLRSRTRASWPGDPGLRYSGYTAWRGVTAGPVALDGSGESLGRGKRFGIGPLADGRVYWFAVVSMPAGATFADEFAEVRRRFGGWHAPIGQLMDATPDTFRTDIYDLAGPLPAFVRGRTVLLGDAAHAMTPDLGQGAGMAIEDAATLVRLLENHPIDEALTAYDHKRRTRTQPIAQRAHRLGQVLQSRHATLRDLALRLTPAGVAARQLNALQSWENR